VNRPRDFPNRTALQRDLRRLAKEYIIVALKAPFGLPYGPKRLCRSRWSEWLSSEVLGPSDRLIEALSAENAFWFSDWPETIADPPDRVVLVRELEKVRKWVGALEFELRVRINERVRHRREFEIELAYDLTELFKRYFPDEPLTLGKHDREYGAVSRYSDFIRVAANQILQDKKRMSRVLAQIKKLQALQTK
jgi:hypothetical protein